MFLRTFPTIFFLQCFILWEFKLLLIFFFSNVLWSKCRRQYLVPNNLRRFSETALCLRLLKALVFEHLIYNLITCSLYLFSRKRCSKCRLQFISENLRFFVLMACFWLILEPKSMLLLTFFIRKFLWLTVLKHLFGHCQPQNLKLITFFGLLRLYY